jgi:ABC-type Na+ transport system ATPase subunit NatA
MIEAQGLVKRYGSTMAVNDLSFSVRPGMVTGFLGPNGDGKTTTMRMILGLDALDRIAVSCAASYQLQRTMRLAVAAGRSPPRGLAPADCS